jgi:predicted dinucleotide-binding enzyme
VVKAFNTTGADNMASPVYPAGKIFMPVCGDDADAKARVIALAASIGFDAVDFGPLDGARYLEPLAMVWIKLAMVQKLGRDFAFGLLRR